MILTNHPNVLQAHCSFTVGHNLWVVMPFMEGGSLLHIIKSAYPEGFEEPVIATVLHEVLKALVYLHAHGHIHRDVKACHMYLTLLIAYFSFLDLSEIWHLLYFGSLVSNVPCSILLMCFSSFHLFFSFLFYCRLVTY